jgi:adenosine/AMP kinase
MSRNYADRKRADRMELKAIEIVKPSADVNVIVGQAHFIKTVEDLYEVIVQAVPGVKFGVAFSEASGPCLVRHTGTDDLLEAAAVAATVAISAGHVFVVMLGNAFPINVLNQIKSVTEVCTIFCATANPLTIVIAEHEGARGVMGVIDGSSPKGVENEADRAERHAMLRKFGYKQ